VFDSSSGWGVGRGAKRPEWSSDQRLFHALVREPSVEIDLPAHAVRDADWSLISGLSRFHGVDGLVAQSILSRRVPAVPDQVLDCCRQRLRQLTFESMRRSGAVLQIIGVLKREGIGALLLKGAAVSQRYYSAPHIRQSIDIDLLISFEDALPAIAALESLDYKRIHPDTPMQPDALGIVRLLSKDVALVNRSGGLSVELHWRLFSNPHLCDPGVLGAVTDQASIAIGNMKVPVLRPPEQFVYLMCHGAWHSWSQLKWLADIDRMLAKMTDAERAEALAIAERNGLSRIVAHGLELNRIVFGAETGRVPEPPCTVQLRPYEMDYLADPMKSSRQSRSIRLQDVGAQIRDLRMQVGLKSGHRYKLMVFAQFFADIRDVQWLRLSQRWLWLYVVVGAFGRMARATARSLRRSDA